MLIWHVALPFIAMLIERTSPDPSDFKAQKRVKVLWFVDIILVYRKVKIQFQSENYVSSPGHFRTPSQDLQTVNTEAQERSQVVAVGTALPTAALPVGAHQGPVMVTHKMSNLYLVLRLPNIITKLELSQKLRASSACSCVQSDCSIQKWQFCTGFKLF